MSPSALCQVVFPLRLKMPCSVTIYWATVRGSVTMAPRARVGTMRDFRLPSPHR